MNDNHPKKGRPKKIKDSNENDNVVHPPKKRGRKKKEKPVIEGTEPKQKKKRGRKAAIKYFSSSIRKQIPLTTVIENTDNYLLHIDVKDDIEEDNNSNINQQNNVKEDTEEEILNNLFQSLELNKDFEIDNYEMDDESILKNIIENNCDLKDLYEKKKDSREKYDKLLLNKLESLHNNETYMVKLLDKVKSLKDEKENKNKNKQHFHYTANRDFVDNDNWLDRTNCACWWCCHTFDTLPIGLPLNFDSKTKKFRVKGVFCSFSCMIAYKNDNKVRNVDHHVRYLYKKLTGTDFIEKANLISAPPRCLLKLFGGDLTIEEFRSKFNEKKKYRMVEYPMIISHEYIEELDIANVKNANSNYFGDNTTVQKIITLDESKINDAKKRLSSNRIKNTITKGNTIDKFLNFD
jgi:hypothetical protein